MDRIDELLLSELACGISLVEQPFDDVAAKLGISVEDVLLRLQNMLRTGVIRRFGATLKPNSIGFTANAVIAWNVPGERVDEVGMFFSSFREVSHCYERSPVPERWNFNMYIVMHASSRKVIEQSVKFLAGTVGIYDYVILYSKRDLKNSVKRGV
ncbi:MAG: Lrp/AsnC family transcriptional regulator [Candidatus Bathyarchaeota archaeon]|nr:Lrp/AsnC family transcriptional regulator [Candidatus Termiticorpusculum sp.]